MAISRNGQELLKNQNKNCFFVYQGGSTTTLVIRRAKNTDAGTYTLEAVNR